MKCMGPTDKDRYAYLFRVHFNAKNAK